MIYFGFPSFNCQCTFDYLFKLPNDISVRDQKLFSTKQTPMYIGNVLNINYFVYIYSRCLLKHYYKSLTFKSKNAYNTVHLRTSTQLKFK